MKEKLLSRLMVLRRQEPVFSVALAVLVGALAIGLSASAASADEALSETPLVSAPASTGVDRIEAETDPEAAAILPKTDLDRGQAEELLQGVFGEELEVPAEFFEELEVESFRSDHVALVTPSLPGKPAGLLSSTLPLRAENEAGEMKIVDLGLERDGDYLQPENPLVDVHIPSELADGISLPETGVDIKLASGSGERRGTEVGEASNFYPNVRPETDVVITAVPTGVETYTQLRSPDAPRQEVFELGMSDSSTLSATQEGGAKVVDENGEAIMSVPAPWAMDATGNQVPTELGVNGHSITVTVNPSAGAVYPILLDPIFESYNFNGQSTAGTLGKDWSGASNQGFGYGWGSYPNYGMTVQGFGGAATSPGSQAMFNYYVPRYWSDIQANLPAPTTYIRSMDLWNLTYMEPEEAGIPTGSRAAYPFMQLGLWGESVQQFNWSLVRYGYEGQWTDGSHVFHMFNTNENQDVKRGGFAIATFDSWNTAWRYVNVQQASVEVTDQQAPTIGSLANITQWVNTQSVPGISYQASDKGLGIYRLDFSYPALAGGSSLNRISLGCTGTAGSACPSASSQATKVIPYDPRLMAQGEDWPTVTAVDPVLQSKSGELRIKVDHTAPQLGLSGSLTEQASVGTKLHEYTLNYNASDGDDAAAAAQAPFGTQGTGAGQVERPQGVAVDAAGNVWVSDKDNNRVLEYDPSGKVLRELPSGTADGQISSPRGIAIAPNGNVWVAEAGNKRLQQFTPMGAFVSKVTNASFIEPWGIAFGPEGALWLTDNAAKRIFKFSQGGVLELSEPSSNINSGVPYGVDVDSFGHPWIAFQGTDQIAGAVELGAGNKLRATVTFGGTGTAAGQFRSPYDIAIAQSGNILVTDALNNRVQDFKPDGTFLRQYGAEGSASNQFKEPRAVAVAPGNTLVVADAGNHRVARWAHADQDPQSGVSKLEVKVDGAVAKSTAPGCSSKNCTISGSWTLNANSYSAGTHKVEVIATDGVGLTTTKTVNIETHGDLVAPGVSLSGSMTEQASVGTTRTTYKLKESATDTGSAAEWKSGVVATTIKVDGTLVDSYNAACATEGCAVTREWTMQSSEYLGSHKVQVTSTDGAGHVTTKELSITINKDVTPPTISTGSEAFFTRPQNWLTQKTYGYTTSATDENASGVVNFQFKIDGVLIKQAYGTCAGGSCSKNLTGEVNVANLAGGAHPAELVASDAAGNSRTRSWTINVDPYGAISTSEAEDTLEAVEETSNAEILSNDSATGSPSGEDWGGDPTLSESGGTIESHGTPVTTTLTGDASDGFVIDTADGEVTVQPVVPSGTQQGAQVSEDGLAAVVASSATNLDTVIRPIFDGSMSFQNIRDASSSETYSWTVTMSSDQTLKLINDQLAGVFTDDRQNFSIVAEPAHDAIGTEVPTTLSVTGNVLTLTVHHRAGNPQAGGAPFTYPVIQGVGWEGGFQVYTEKLPLTEQEEGIQNEELWGGWGYVSPPEQVTSEDPEALATASSGNVYGDGLKRHFVWVLCSHAPNFAPNGDPLRYVPDGDPTWEHDCGNPWAEDPGVEVYFFEAMHGKFFQRFGPKHSDFAVYHEGGQHDSIGCLAGGFGAKKEEPGGTFRRGSVSDCVWWGTTQDNRPKYAIWGEHITPVLHADAEERSSCGDNCNGTPNPWVFHDMPPMAYYLWASEHYAKHVTNCIDC